MAARGTPFYAANGKKLPFKCQFMGDVPASHVCFFRRQSVGRELHGFIPRKANVEISGISALFVGIPQG